MADKILGTLDTMRLKLTLLLPHPQAVLYFDYPVHFTLSWKVFVYPNIVLGEGRGGEGRAIRGIRTIAKVDIMLHLHI